ncbi:MAG: TIGR00725 family protein [Deltaproteobacteria bacterium]|nr:TIGR00725 family protein [Deltaproteobacteria bacterium]MBW2048869.1 TIGR00725 family protein [Deltaproteobacteria bacterium]MBW2112388.1 TIGR00725 family protein [Deltaproteobacteria bacterium]MBW2352578.1 TIGR00725 family protein [Deltaproteobacteria bacterium]
MANVFPCGEHNPVRRPPYVGVIGAGSCTARIYDLAREIGLEIGKRGWTLVCGGLGGVMEGASLGCSEAGGMTLGILPGMDKGSANPYISVPIATGLGDGRNLLVVRCSDILVAVSGGYGTLSEIALALKGGKPVIGLGTWNHIPGIRYAEDCGEAIRLIDFALGSGGAG